MSVMKNVKMAFVGVSAAVVAVVASAVLLVGCSDGEDEDLANVNIDKADLRQDMTAVNTTSAVQTVVEILFENTAVPIGTTLKVTALVTPDDSDKAIVWTSSDEAIFSVDTEGFVTVEGVGTAILTATVGSVSDSVVIEGIESVMSGSSNGYVVYTQGSITGSSGSGSNVAYSSGNSGSTDSSGSSGSSSKSGASDSGSGSGGSSDSGYYGSDGDSSGSGSNVAYSSGNSGSTDSSGSSGGSGGSGSSDSGSGSDGDSSDGGSSAGDSGSSGSDGNSGSGSSSSEIGDVLSENGFEQTTSNVYVCQENGTYYGEIITQSNATIIYIKQRNDDFDSKIKSVIESLLPGNSTLVWNNYLAAGTDRTFTLDDRRVRIVVATGGGHSQIVIYN